MGPQWVVGGVSGHCFYMEARDDLADKLIQPETQESEEAAVRHLRAVFQAEESKCNVLGPQLSEEDSGVQGSWSRLNEEQGGEVGRGGDGGVRLWKACKPLCILFCLTYC